MLPLLGSTVSNGMPQNRACSIFSECWKLLRFCSFFLGSPVRNFVASAVFVIVYGVLKIWQKLLNLTGLVELEATERLPSDCALPTRVTNWPATAAAAVVPATPRSTWIEVGPRIAT